MPDITLDAVYSPSNSGPYATSIAWFTYPEEFNNNNPFPNPYDVHITEKLPYPEGFTVSFDFHVDNLNDTDYDFDNRVFPVNVPYKKSGFGSYVYSGTKKNPLLSFYWTVNIEYTNIEVKDQQGRNVPFSMVFMESQAIDEIHIFHNLDEYVTVHPAEQMNFVIAVDDIKDISFPDIYPALDAEVSAKNISDSKKKVTKNETITKNTALITARKGTKPTGVMHDILYTDQYGNDLHPEYMCSYIRISQPQSPQYLKIECDQISPEWTTAVGIRVSPKYIDNTNYPVKCVL